MTPHPLRGCALNPAGPGGLGLLRASLVAAWEPLTR